MLYYNIVTLLLACEIALQLKLLFFTFNRENAYPSISVKLASRWEMHAGSCIVSSTVYNRTVWCPRTKALDNVMIRSTRSLVRLVQGNTCHVLSSAIWNQLLWVS